ncbi:MAG: hypothetical protein WBR18_11385, partial [Anaerolineales bacterium]
MPNLIEFYRADQSLPAAATAHYADGGLSAALWRQQGGPPFTITAHSLGAQKVDRLLAQGERGLAALDDRFLFRRRIAAERVAMSYASRIITSTEQERREQYGHPVYADAVDPANDDRFAVIPP